MPVAQLTLSETQQAIANLWGTDWLTMSARMSEYGLTPAEMASNEFLRQWSGGAVEPIYARNGETILGYNFRADASTVRTGLNSNTSIVARGNVNHAPSTVIETVGTNAGKVKVSRLSGLGTKAVTAASKLAAPIALASIGISLGKTIDEGLYNAFPDFFNEHGLRTFNPQTWDTLAGNDETGKSFINAIFGIDKDTGETQAYIDSNAYAYMAQYLASLGVFNMPSYVLDSYTPVSSDWNLQYPERITYPFNFYPVNVVSGVNNSTGVIYTYSATGNSPIYCVLGYYQNRDRLYTPYFFSRETFTQTLEYSTGGGTTFSTSSFTIDGVTYYYSGGGGSNSYNAVSYDIPYQLFNGNPDSRDMLKLIFSNQAQEIGGVPGIGNQTGATLPDTTGWLDLPSTLSSLQNQYPNVFNNAISYPVVQPDGTVINHDYVPITLPVTSNPTDTQPLSGNQTQQNPVIDPSTTTQNVLDLLTKLLQQPMTEPITDNPQTPQNPTDTGDGSSPVPTPPVGSASSLWKIYHPTQAQVDSFGGWLWSSNFIDQILKIFNNPMEAVIGLHKVYATPIDAGNATIKVGYLDSQIPSAYIEQQYIDVSCGSVNLYEQFGNVFDYSPFTDVKLYLPFVGIVPLNIADVMRSTISITYGVDVLTGACLAQVEVSRDGNSSVLYQYSGNCAVQYPISSGSYMGIVSSIISVAGGVAATVASGGAAAPLALGAMGGIMSAHTSVQNSGGFSGNAGAMGGKIPYLIITRPQTKVADNAESLQGYRTNSYTTIGECEGYIKADSVHIINVNATDEELTEINNLILSGIII